MWLEGQHQPPSRIALAQRLQGRRDFRGMVAVVVHDGHQSGGQRHIADMLQAPVDALKRSQGPGDRSVIYA